MEKSKYQPLNDSVKLKDYYENFWNYLTLNSSSYEVYLSKGRHSFTNSYIFPYGSLNTLNDKITNKSDMRKLCTVIPNYRNAAHVFFHNHEEEAKFVEEGGQIPVFDGFDNLKLFEAMSNDLAVLVKYDVDIIADESYDLKTNLTDKLACAFSRGEDKGFICGSGTNEPYGILHNTEGSKKSHETSSLTYDDIITLYFNVDKKYRDNGTFMMNDKTAKLLRTLKDSDGNYIWNQANDTILSKKIVINNNVSDEKPVIFGDFKYYWIILRHPITVRTLTENITETISYLSHEFLDGMPCRMARINNDTYWNPASISAILQRQEYLGKTVNFKTYRKSYKNKKSYDNDKSNWKILDNTHEAIIGHMTKNILYVLLIGMSKAVVHHIK